jgi:hypothetical protein
VWDWLSFGDLMQIAAEIYQRPVESLEERVCIFRAQSALAAPFIRIQGALFHSDPVERAVICALRVIRTRPFPDGRNTAIGFWCMREMLLRSHYIWLRPDEDAEEIEEVMRRVEARTMSDPEFLRWVRERVELGTGLEGAATA